MKLLLQLLKAEHLNFISQMLEKSLSDGCLLRKMSDSTALRTKPRGINMRHQIICDDTNSTSFPNYVSITSKADIVLGSTEQPSLVPVNTTGLKNTSTAKCQMATIKRNVMAPKHWASDSS